MTGQLLTQAVASRLCVVTARELLRLTTSEAKKSICLGAFVVGHAMTGQVQTYRKMGPGISPGERTQRFESEFTCASHCLVEIPLYTVLYIHKPL